VVMGYIDIDTLKSKQDKSDKSQSEQRKREITLRALHNEFLGWVCERVAART